MRSTSKVVLSLIFGLTLLFSAAAVYGDDDVYDDDDLTPGVDARVSRISFIRGDVQIRREGSEDWEKAVLNLPIVEGDEIVTDANARLEIQLSLYSHIRLAESSSLKIIGLKDGAVALSLAEGTMSVRLTRFDTDEGYFEVDAPKTTVAMQKSGMYRIDAGRPGSGGDIRVTIADEGEARVYSDSSGFTLKRGRSATLKIDGPLAGEWETLDAARVADEFDSWTLDRDAIVARQINDAYYDKYYDQDMYGAEDLNNNGEWVYTKTYGYVWRPYSSAIASYSGWSPYRYGTWRWVPPYGWTWVNDEPWAWATYHYGRWFFDNGSWYWAPYGYVRTRRSWWFPALIGVNIVNNNVYWYPLPHGYGYFNYNDCFGGWGGHHGHQNGGHNNGGHNNGGHNNGGHNNGNNGPGGPVATPTPPKYVGPLAGQIGPSVFTDNDSRKTWRLTPPLLRVPPGAVVGTPLSSFGRDKTGAGASVPERDARIALSKPLGENKQTRVLPTYQELEGRVSTAIKSQKPRQAVLSVKPTGAAVRPAGGAAMDRVLRETKVFGGRDPVRPQPNDQSPRAVEPRKTGAVTREPVRPQADPPVRPERVVLPTKSPANQDVPVRPEPPRETRTSKPREEKSDAPVRPEPRRVETQKAREEPARQPRNDPPPTRSEPVRSEPPRSSPPPRSEPVRSAPAPAREPSPSKSSEPSRSTTPASSKKRDS